ncbi:hypothetical protein L484_010586 [Morus notabilis]|uniref:Stress-associated endoplasmic reticulum protein 2 n=1 Tax=Morus notabilis TaxID=981085 RepID=W9QNJ3_9ROSA|nr:hypothetical protein L484_010586 [Morus notabilis]
MVNGNITNGKNDFCLSSFCKVPASTSPLLSFRSFLKTTSKRVAEKKVAKFQRNITKRGSVPETSSKKGYDFPVGPILLGFFIFVVIGSCIALSSYSSLSSPFNLFIFYLIYSAPCPFFLSPFVSLDILN